MIFTKQYPHLAWWIDNNGWVALGTDEDSDSIMRLIDPSGTCWEDDDSGSIDKALGKAELFLKKLLPVRFPNRFVLEV
jgi:hypothetical protein